MYITLDKVKAYLRIDGDDENELLMGLFSTSCQLVADVLRVESLDDFSDNPKVDIAIFYSIAYLYEHREEADHKTLVFNIRTLLFGLRNELF